MEVDGVVGGVRIAAVAGSRVNELTSPGAGKPKSAARFLLENLDVDDIESPLAT
jgi:hypothetical protein